MAKGPIPPGAYVASVTLTMVRDSMKLTMRHVFILLQLQKVAITLEERSEVAIMTTACKCFGSIFYTINMQCRDIE